MEESNFQIVPHERKYLHDTVIISILKQCTQHFLSMCSSPVTILFFLSHMALLFSRLRCPPPKNKCHDNTYLHIFTRSQRPDPSCFFPLLRICFLNLLLLLSLNDYYIPFWMTKMEHPVIISWDDQGRHTISIGVFIYLLERILDLETFNV